MCTHDSIEGAIAEGVVGLFLKVAAAVRIRSRLDNSHKIFGPMPGGETN